MCVCVVPMEEEEEYGRCRGKRGRVGVGEVGWRDGGWGRWGGGVGEVG